MRPRRLRPEEAHQVQVGHLLGLLGWTWAHFRPARSAGGRVMTPVQGPGGAGYPDLTCWRPAGWRGAGRVMWLELKAARGTLSAAQRQQLATLAGAGAEVYVVRPVHLELLREVAEARERPSLELVAPLLAWTRGTPTSARAGARERVSAPGPRPPRGGPGV